MKPRIKRESHQLVILTGLSGSGKSTVLKAFEDMGFYCVDNMPVELIPIFAELHEAGEGDFSRAALLVDAREGAQLQKLPGLLTHLRKDHPISLVFIEANDDALLRRYSETRRPHPLGKDYSVRESLLHERELMVPIRKLADLVIDSGDGSTLASYASAYPQVVAALLAQVSSTLGVDVARVIAGDAAIRCSFRW